MMSAQFDRSKFDLRALGKTNLEAHICGMTVCVEESEESQMWISKVIDMWQKERLQSILIETVTDVRNGNDEKIKFIDATRLWKTEINDKKLTNSRWKKSIKIYNTEDLK